VVDGHFGGGALFLIFLPIIIKVLLQVINVAMRKGITGSPKKQEAAVKGWRAGF